MSKPAVMKGTYVDLRFMPGLKCARLSIDIPIEQSNEFLTMFGAPDRANPVWCAVARLQAAPSGANKENGPDVLTRAVPVPTDAVNLPPHAEAEGQDKPRTRGQIAGMKLKDPSFQLWIARQCTKTVVMGATAADTADAQLKLVLRIGSKTELNEGPKADAWDRLLASYEAETKWGVR